MVKKLNKKYLIGIAKFFVCLLVLIFIYSLAQDFETYINKKLFRSCLLIILITLIIRKKTTKVATSFLLIMAPFVGMVFFQSVQGIVTDLITEPPPEIKQPIFEARPDKPRVLWLLFDRFDYQIAFVDRPDHLKMPAFDRLLQQSLSAENAYPPGMETITSLPALIDGKIVSEVCIDGPDKLKIIYQGSEETVYWGSQPNLFTKARALEMNTALVGEYLPYSRIIGKDLTFCDWTQYYNQYTSSGSVFANVYQQLRMLCIGPARHHVQMKESYYHIQNLTKELVSKPEYNLIMIHNPIPHPPYFYKEHFWGKGGLTAYIHALELVDYTVAEIRQLMEEQGTWDNTTVIISADHGIESKVPFIIKLANQTQPVIYEPAFNTVITQEIILAILRKDITTPEQLVTFLRENGRMIEPVRPKQP
ncbi:MAG: sulfatase-like hydrolase/transferase [Firmicutes bacterium]|nr:sulfatase-like hydrolase/transferase [Bacillota bacterium]